MIQNHDELTLTVKEIVAKQPITDVHTHLFSPNMNQHGPLLLWGVDELVTYHYLIAEVMRWSDITPDAYYALSKPQQADLIWQKLFIEHSPVGEAQRGVLTALRLLGCDVTSRDLNACRQVLVDATAQTQVDAVLRTANIQHVVMTNDPLDDAERAFWDSGVALDPRFHAVLRIDPLIFWPEQIVPRLRGWGYDVPTDFAGSPDLSTLKQFLQDWVVRMKPLYVACSVQFDADIAGDSLAAKVIREAVLPVCRQFKLPFALMIGVDRQVNPPLRSAGDGVGVADLGGLKRLLQQNPDVKFLSTLLARENQQGLVVLGRKFRNLMPFGCWWFMNNPVLIEETTRMRMEMLGTSFIPQHSDARILEQLLYKWDHSRQIIAKVLIDKYADVLATGWRIERGEIERDVADLLHNNFWRFVGREPAPASN